MTFNPGVDCLIWKMGAVRPSWRQKKRRRINMLYDAFFSGAVRPSWRQGDRSWLRLRAPCALHGASSVPGSFRLGMERTGNGDFA